MTITNDSALRFREHDFGNVLTNLRKYMSNQKDLSDYDLDATVLDHLLSVLSADTQNNAITANAMFAEVGIDSAQQRKNMAMHAKRYTYVPYSANAAKAIVNITVTVSSSVTAPAQITLAKGTAFNALGDTISRFVTNRSYTAELNVDRYEFENVEIFEGTYGALDILIDKSSRTQIYELAVDNIDTNFLEVYVQRDTNSEDFEEWRYARDSILVTGDSKVYFMQETPNGKYGLEFGDNVIGKSVRDQSIVRVVYLKTSGLLGNNFREFTFSYAPNEYSPINTNAFQTTVVTVEKATGGFDRETIDSIRRNAPKFYVTQNRGNTATDYEDLIRTKYPYINAISVWRGKEGRGFYDQLGRIYISAKSNKSQFLTESQKTEIYNGVIDEFGNAGIVPLLVDVDNTYIDITSKVFVEDLVFLTSEVVEDSVREYMINYNEKELGIFGGAFEHSPFATGIDNVSNLINSNLTTIRLHKRVFPDTRVNTSFSFTFHNQIVSLETNSFEYGLDVRKVFMRATNEGIINIYEVSDGNEVIVQPNVGTVDFKTGDVMVRDITILRTNPTTKDIRFYAVPKEENVESSKNNILEIDKMDVNVSRKIKKK